MNMTEKIIKTVPAVVLFFLIVNTPRTIEHTPSIGTNSDKTDVIHPHVKYV